MTERMFTAAEVQAAITAVIRYERALAEHRMRAAAAPLLAAIEAHRREIKPGRFLTLKEIRRHAAMSEEGRRHTTA